VAGAVCWLTPERRLSARSGRCRGR